MNELLIELLTDNQNDVRVQKPNGVVEHFVRQFVNDFRVEFECDLLRDVAGQLASRMRNGPPAVHPEGP